nr:restriction endonuclease subunit S [Kribbella shirazensis]
MSDPVIHYSIPSLDSTGGGSEESPDDIRSSKLRLRGGEVLISKLNPRKSRVTVAARSAGQDVVASTEFVAMLPSIRVHARYLMYVLLAENVRQELDSMVQSVTRSHQRVSPEQILRLKVALPPFEEQWRIVNFLDSATSRIDRQIEIGRRQIALLGERLHAKAAEATGRVTIRGSVVAGEWTPLQLRRVVEVITTGATPQGGAEGVWAEEDPAAIPWYTPSEMDDWMQLAPAMRYVPRDGRGEAKTTFRAGSVVLVCIGESIGKVTFLDHAATGNQQLTAIRPNSLIDGRFLAWQLWGAAGEIRDTSPFTRVRIINGSDLLAFPIMLPSRERQVEIRRALDAEKSRTMVGRDKIARFAAGLTERRQALITAAVTGQIDVTTARGVGVS